MDLDVSRATTRGAVDLEIDEHVVQVLRDRLPAVATETVAAVVVEVPSYAGALSGSMGTNIEAAVQMALGGFLKLVSRSRESDPSTRSGPPSRVPTPSAGARPAPAGPWTRCSPPTG